MKRKPLPLTHPWRRDKIGNSASQLSAREKALAEVKRRQKTFSK